jgi:Mrp family chromosome partitioning ATPase
MTQSPPKASFSSRPPGPGTDGGRRITALAAGGSVFLLSITAVALWPRTYGTEATFVVNGGNVSNPTALAGRIEATLLERDELARVAIELPPELRSPDPIGRLRAGIRVQSRGALGYVVEFRGSEPQSVQRITNQLADRAVALVPKLTASPRDQAPAEALAARTRAVTEFLTAHPEVTLEAPSGKSASQDSGLEALRTEKRQIEQRLTTGATDNPYADPGQNPELLNRRLTELKNTIARREKALKEPRPGAPAAVSPDLVAQWRQLLADLAAAQSSASAPAAPSPVLSARVTARAPLPTSPLTPNRLVLSLVALLLSAAAAMVAYVLPRKPEPARRHGPRSTRGGTEPLLALAPGVSRSEPLRPRSSEPPNKPSDPSIPRTDSPPPIRSGSDAPGPIAVQRPVVLSGEAGPNNNSSSTAIVPARSHTAPGGLEAPSAQAISLANAALAAPPPAPAAPLFGSRPPPGAGSYSVSSSHPPPMDPRSAGGRTAVERLSPLHTARPPSQSPPPAARRGSSPSLPPEGGPQIMSRPPALDPDAEIWAARFEAPPPPEQPAQPAEPAGDSASEGESPRKRAGRWKTQVMGSMVPLEVMAAREARPPESDALESIRQPRQEPLARQAPSPASSTVVHHDVPMGWMPNIDTKTPEVLNLRDAVLQAASGQRLTLLVTGAARPERAQVASALGLALAEAGARALLLEADFDNPELHRALSLSTPPSAGFSQQLMARRHAKQHEPWVVVRCSANLQVLAEGRFRSPGLVASKEFERALAELREQHHIVLIHAPALSRPDDLRPLGPLAQGLVLVEPGKPSQLRLGEQPLRGLL